MPQSKVLACERLSQADLRQHLAGLPTSAALQFVHGVLSMLVTLAPGRYLLTHAPHDPTVCLFKALPEELLGGEVRSNLNAGIM